MAVVGHVFLSALEDRPGFFLVALVVSSFRAGFWGLITKNSKDYLMM